MINADVVPHVSEMILEQNLHSAQCFCFPTFPLPDKSLLFLKPNKITADLLDLFKTD